MRNEFWNREARRPSLICLALAFATVGVYWQVRSFEFTNYDEFLMILKNPIVRGGLTPDGFVWALTTSWFEYWHPLTWLSHMLDCELFGLDAGWHHIVSLAFHTANTVLVFTVLQRLTRALWRCALVAALFALHPLHVESVAWLAERKDVLSAFFFLLTLWAYTRYVEEAKVQRPRSNVQSPTPEAGHQDREPATPASILHPPSSIFPRSGSYWLSLGFFVLGLMSKPMLITLPFVLLLLDYWPLGRIQVDSQHSTLKNWRPLLHEKVPFFILTGLSCAITYFGAKAGGNVLSNEAVPWSLRLANVPVSYLRYLIKFVYPANLAVLYPMPQHWPWWQVASAVFVLILLTVLVLARARSSPYLIFGWFTFFGMLVPTLGLVQVGFQSIADRYTYLPSIGLFVGMVWWVAEASRQYTPLRLALPGSAVAVLITCGVLTWRQAGYWRNSQTLWTHCVQVTPENAIAHYNLGYALEVAGKNQAAAMEYEQALHFNPNHVNANINLGTIHILDSHMVEATNLLVKALRLQPDSASAQANLGLALRELGDYQGAVIHCAEAIRLDPDNDGPFLDMARALSALGRPEESLNYYAESLQRNPSRQAHYFYGLALLKLGRLDEAISQFREAVRQAPDWPDAHLELALALSSRGAMAEAIAEYREVLRLDPNSTLALNNLSWILATHPDYGLRNGAEAVELAHRACEQTAWKQTVCIGTLAAAYAEAGQFDKALETSHRACQLARSLGETNLLARNQELLRKFESHQAYRE